jgi:hypothetical protein
MEENKKLDIYQFHYYDSSVEWHDTDMERLDYHKQTISDYDERALLDGKPVIAGEIDPTYVEDKLDTLANHGYDGVLFWDDKGNVFDAAEHREALDWTPGTVRTFYEGSRRVRTVAEPDLEGDGSVYRYYFDESIYNSGTEYEHGRTYLEVKSEVNEFGSKAYEYVYFDNDPFTPEVKYEYHTVDLTDRTNPLFSGLVASYEYDDTGNLLKKKWHSTYYANTWRQRTWRDAIRINIS